MVALRAIVNSIADFETQSTDAKTTAETTRRVIPDVISVDFSETLDFSTFNGRLHGDLATDVMVNLILGRENMSDDIVEAKTFLKEFPYLESPNNK